MSKGFNSPYLAGRSYFTSGLVVIIIIVWIQFKFMDAIIFWIY